MRKPLTTFLLGAMLVTGIAPTGNSAAETQSSQRKTRKTSASVKSSATKKKGSKKRRVSRRNRGQKAPTTNRVSEIQQALAREGAYSGEPTGKWDAATVGAMKRFQSSQGLNPTGKLDARSLQKLGLGSQTAGVAAPLPPSNPSPKAATSDKSTERSPSER